MRSDRGHPRRLCSARKRKPPPAPPPLPDRRTAAVPAPAAPRAPCPWGPPDSTRQLSPAPPAGAGRPALPPPRPPGTAGPPPRGVRAPAGRGHGCSGTPAATAAAPRPGDCREPGRRRTQCTPPESPRAATHSSAPQAAEHRVALPLVPSRHDVASRRGFKRSISVHQGQCCARGRQAMQASWPERC